MSPRQSPDPMTLVALVTGAARGIGAALVHELCARDYRVVALDACLGEDGPPGVAYALATVSDLAQVAARHPDRVLPVRADVRDPAAMDAAVRTAVDHFGRLDVAVAAAAVIIGGTTAWEADPAHLRTLLDSNVLGVWNTAAATIPVLLAAEDPGRCRFVAIASAAGERGLHGLAAYGMTKHAVIGIVRGLAADLVGTGVTAAAVSPGSTRTAMLEATAALYHTDPAELARHQDLRRLIEPAEIARVVAGCCAAEGALFNGSVVHADGGFTG